MKTLKSNAVDLRKLDKGMRNLIKLKREESRSQLYKDLKALLLSDNISQRAFINLFKTHSTGILADYSDVINNVRFKQNGVPDMRSLPKEIRDIFKSVESDIDNAKADLIKSASMNINFETISFEDLLNVQKIVRDKSFQNRWTNDILVPGV